MLLLLLVHVLLRCRVHRLLREVALVRIYLRRLRIRLLKLLVSLWRLLRLRLHGLILHLDLLGLASSGRGSERRGMKTSFTVAMQPNAVDRKRYDVKDAETTQLVSHSLIIILVMMIIESSDVTYNSIPPIPAAPARAPASKINQSQHTTRISPDCGATYKSRWRHRSHPRRSSHNSRQSSPCWPHSRQAWGRPARPARRRR